MAKLTVHAAESPTDSWLEVDGHRLEGVKVVVASEKVAYDEITLTVYANSNENGIQLVWEEEEEK